MKKKANMMVYCEEEGNSKQTKVLLLHILHLSSMDQYQPYVPHRPSLVLDMQYL